MWTVGLFSNHRIINEYAVGTIGANGESHSMQPMIVKLINETGNVLITDAPVFNETIRMLCGGSEETFCWNGNQDANGVPIFRFAGRMPIEFLINPFTRQD